MAIAVANKSVLARLSGNVQLLTASITLDTAYPTGGSPGVAAALGLQSILLLHGNDSRQYHVEYVAGDRLKVSFPGGAGAGSKAAEVANNANLSADVITVFVIGVSS